MSETVPKLTQLKYGKGRIQIQMLIILLIYSFLNYKLLFIYFSCAGSSLLLTDFL